MTSYRRNLDKYTENFHIGFYFNYLSKWPEYFVLAESFDGRPIAYVMGKSEGKDTGWHGHVTAVTVAPSYRRLGLARHLMDCLEAVSEKGHMYFVDLFVRTSNQSAIDMYRNFGYTIYRRVLNYYTGLFPEDAYDMRKALSRDVHKKSIVPLPCPVHADDLDY